MFYQTSRSILVVLKPLGQLGTRTDLQQRRHFLRAYTLVKYLWFSVFSHFVLIVYPLQFFMGEWFMNFWIVWMWLSMCRTKTIFISATSRPTKLTNPVATGRCKGKSLFHISQGLHAKTAFHRVFLSVRILRNLHVYSTVANVYTKLWGKEVEHSELKCRTLKTHLPFLTFPLVDSTPCHFLTGDHWTSVRGKTLQNQATLLQKSNIYNWETVSALGRFHSQTVTILH